jgi:hypothetical protein
VNTREAKRRLKFIQEHGEAERSIESMLRRFHVAKEIGKMNDPCHVRFREFNPSDSFELISHAG